MKMEAVDYFYELYTGLSRGGPGDNASTRKAYSFMKNVPGKPVILDIGCGPGMQTLELARISGGTVVALDNYQPFLEKLLMDARKEGLDRQITIRNHSMLDLDYEDETFDVIWSEGALYFMGVINALIKCWKLLKPGGYLAFTEMVYLTDDPPDAVVKYFQNEYPSIKTIRDNLDLIQAGRFKLLAHFTIPDPAWVDNYYVPIEKKIKKLNKKYKGNRTALGVFGDCLKEAGFYKRYSRYYGYEFFVMQK